MEYSDDRQPTAERLATGLGWFSIALGAAELIAPSAMARFIGVRDEERTETLMRAYGAREIGTGLAILAQPDRAQWLWSRVAGDVLDLSSLGSALTQENANGGRVAAAAAAVIGVTALDVVAARRVGRAGDRAGAKTKAGVRVEQVVTINRSIEDVYRFWRDFENLPRFMRHLESVRSVGGGRTRWRAKAPAGTSVQWDAELIQEVDNEWIAWRSVAASDVQNSGSVRFRRAPGARGTELRVQLEYVPPAGAIGRGIAWLFGEEPEQQIREDLHRFKQLMETGEVTISDGPGMWRAAQPAARTDQMRSDVGVQR